MQRCQELNAALPRWHITCATVCNSNHSIFSSSVIKCAHSTLRFVERYWDALVTGLNTTTRVKPPFPLLADGHVVELVSCSLYTIIVPQASHRLARVLQGCGWVGGRGGCRHCAHSVAHNIAVLCVMKKKAFATCKCSGKIWQAADP